MKLTVAEASKRGYATGLSILQAVQKEWLTAEKAPDGQLLVDIADLEQVFGLPKDATPASAALSDSAPARSPDSANRAPTSPRPDPADENRTPAGDGRNANDAPSEPAEDATLNSAADRDARPADGLPPSSMTADEDNAHLVAEIERLTAELDHERRHVSALLEVLTNRLLPAAEPAESDPPQDPVSSTIPLVEPLTSLNPESLDSAEPAGQTGMETNAQDTNTPTVEGISAAPTAADTTISAVPATVLQSQTPTAAKEPTFLWRLWWLMSLVWVGMIGSFYWFALDFPADIQTAIEWIRGGPDAPDLMTAASAIQHGIRDTFGPPAALFILMWLARAIYRSWKR